MSDKALIVVDLVNDFMPKDFYPEAKLPVKPLKDIFEFIRKTIALARKHELPIIFLCDEHEKGDEEFEIYGEHCLKGTEGSRITDKIEVIGGDRIIKKDEPNGFSNPKLNKVLQMKGIEEVYLIGVVTDICIKATALSARDRGYKSKIVKQAVSGFNNKNKGIEELEEKGIEIIELKDLEEEFQE